MMNYLGLLPGSGGGTTLTIVNAGSGSASGVSAAAAAAAAAERIDRGATWSDPEVDELLNIWTNGNVQAELKEATIKKHIFERIARSLREKGFYRTAEQCREKIKRLKKEYRQAMNNNYRCVRGRATVKFFPRLQAVLDGCRPSPKSFYLEAGSASGGGAASPAMATTKVDEHGEVTVIATTTSSGSIINNNNNNNVTTGSSGYGLNLKRSPHAYSECSAEEIKVEVNPAEVDNDSLYENNNSSSIADHMDTNSRRNSYLGHRHSLPAHLNHNHHHALSFNIPAYNHLGHSTRHLTIQRRMRAGGTISNGAASSAASASDRAHHGSNSSSGQPVNLCTADDDVDDLEDADEEGSSQAGSVTPTHDVTPTQNSPEPLNCTSSGGRKRKFNRMKNSGGAAAAISSQTFRDTLDLALDRFLKHQRESEERLFAWEERRIQMELEAEERFRQDDREMLRQIFASLQASSASTTHHTSPASTASIPSASNPEPSPSSSGGSHSNDR